MRKRRGPRHAQKTVSDVDTAITGQLTASFSHSRFWGPILPSGSTAYGEVRVYDGNGALVKTIPPEELAKRPPQRWQMSSEWLGLNETREIRKISRRGTYAYTP